jgi:hypothetical protein
VAAGDEGGAMTNGANHTGVISLGDLDMWSFTANAGDSISLSIGLVDPSATLRPFIRLRNPQGVEVGSDASTLRAAIDITAAQGGLYTLVVASGASVPTGTGSYVLTLAQTPGAFVVSAGDEGGAMTNGANHPGVITLGDLDQWTFTAAQGDSLSLSIGLVDPGATLRPFIRLRNPNGVEIGSAASTLLAQINVTAPQTGLYTVVIASALSFPQGTGSYVITLAKTPGTFIVSPGDEGGAMTNGANHAGVINLGDLDMWTFSAAQGDSISLSIGVVGSPSLRPFIRLRDPNGVEVASDAAVLLAQINVTAPQTGLYTVVIASAASFPQGTGSYVLTLAQTPAAFIVSPGDEGGPMTNGANHAGAINLGDLDMWTFTAAQGDAISLSMGVVGSPTLRPFIRLRNPQGVEIGSAANFLIAQINVTALQTGLYTVVVASGFSFPQGTGSYLLTLAKTPGTFIVPVGDEGGPMTNGTSHPGAIHLGDLDQWTFTATEGHAISLSMGVVGSPTLRPFIRLRDPSGVEVGSAQSFTIAQINVTAAQTGLYTVVAASGLSLPQGTGSYTLTVTGAGLFFTDDPLIPGVTPIKAVHIRQLRARINMIRLRFALPAFVFTDANLSDVVAKRLHVLELRTALEDAYVAAVRTVPSYTDLTLTPQETLIKVVHIMELRAAVLALE